LSNVRLELGGEIIDCKARQESLSSACFGSQKTDYKPDKKHC